MKKPNKTWAWTAAAMGLLLAGSALAWVPAAAAPAKRSDCPGLIECPITGETICRDLCPLEGEPRPDCPGTVECPIDGAVICKDRCPLGASDEAASARAGSCCEE